MHQKETLDLLSMTKAVVNFSISVVFQALKINGDSCPAVDFIVIYLLININSGDFIFKYTIIIFKKYCVVISVS
jgi:hypothetical protein